MQNELGNILIEASVTEALPEYSQVIDLYEEAFPPEERFPVDELNEMAALPAIDFTAYFDEDAADEGGEASGGASSGRTLCGFTYSVISDPYLYLLFLAVSASERGRGYGSQILSQVKARYPGLAIVLDIEPLDPEAPNSEQRVRRLAFYERNGFSLTGYDLYEDDMRYTVLSTLPADEFDPDAFSNAMEAATHGVFPMRLVRASD